MLAFERRLFFGKRLCKKRAACLKTKNQRKKTRRRLSEIIRIRCASGLFHIYTLHNIICMQGFIAETDLRNSVFRGSVYLLNRGAFAAGGGGGGIIYCSDAAPCRARRRARVVPAAFWQENRIRRSERACGCGSSCGGSSEAAVPLRPRKARAGSGA